VDSAVYIARATTRAKTASRARFIPRVRPFFSRAKSPFFGARGLFGEPVGDALIISKMIIKTHACIKVIQKFGMTFPKNRTYRVCPKFAETEINRHFGKT
jgi:hypothetical protein